MHSIKRRQVISIPALGKLTRAAMIACAVAILAPAGQAQEAAAEAQLMPVTVVRAAQMDLEESETFTGRVEAIESVALQAKVAGYLKAKHFAEGGTIAVGDLLFELEDDTYRNRVSGAGRARGVRGAKQTRRPDL